MVQIYNILKKKEIAYLANVSPGIAGYDPRISVFKVV